MTDLGILSSYLRIEIMHEATCTWLNQKSYIQTIHHAFKMSKCNSARTLMEAQLKLVKDEKEDEANSSQFRSLRGILKYLLNTRLDIPYSVNYLSRYMNKPSSEHMSAAKRILGYIKRMSSVGLRYERGKKNYSIQGFSDNDFAGDSDDQKSTTGRVFYGEFCYHMEYSEAKCSGVIIL